MLLVRMTSVCLNETTRPALSVSLPSSITWSRIENTSGWAFSISSNSTMLQGLLLTASVSFPPSPYPT